MSHESSELTRRNFAKAAVAAVTVPVLAPLAACTPSSAPSAEAPAPAAAPDSTAAGAAAQSQEPTPLARALGEAVRVQYGDRLDAEQFGKVQRGITGVQEVADRLRRFPLPIATEPSFVYRVPGGAA